MLRVLFWPVYAPSLLFSSGIGAMGAVQVLAALSLGASEALSSALVSLAAVAALVSTIPAGIAIDRLGDRRAMTAATLSASIFIGVSAVALAIPGPWALPAFVASLVLQAPTLAAWNLARQAVVAEAVPTAQRGQAMTALGGTLRIGNLLGPLAGALLLLRLPLWSVYCFGLGCAIISTGMLYLKRASLPLSQALDAARNTEADSPQPVRWRAVRLVGIAITVLAVARFAQPILITLWCTHLGWSAAQISLVIAVGAAIELVVMVPGGYLKDTLGRSMILGICLASYGFGFLLAPAWPSSPGLIAAVIVMSLGNGLGAGINMTIGADLSPSTGRAQFLSVWAMFTQGGAVCGPLLISGLLLVSSLPLAMAAMGALSGAGAVWIAAVARTVALPGRRRASRPPGA